MSTQYLYDRIWKIRKIISSRKDFFGDFLTIFEDAQGDIREEGIDIEGFHAMKYNKKILFS